jgi:sugar lactone lactonase YvrE
MQYRQLQTISGKGPGPAQFREALRGIAVDSHGRILAAGDSEIKLFTAEEAISRRWSTAKPAYCVAVASDGNVYAGETGQIEIFDPAGKLLNTWRDEKLLGRVTAIGFTKDGVLAGDAADRAIRHYDRNGKFLNTIGKDNPVNGFLIPNGVVNFAVDAHGIIHVANPGKHCVERYEAGGKLLGRIGKFSGADPAGFTGCCNPTNVALSDCLYTAEKGGPRVKAYDSAGNLLAVVATDAFDANCKNMSIAAAGKRLYVADTVKLAILAFEREEGKAS